jgi:hypothetical protein
MGAMVSIQIFGAGMILRSICFAVTLLSVSFAAQAQTAKGEVSDKTLKTLKALAWQSLPSKIILNDKRVIEIDKSDPSKIIIPDEEAREVIKVAHLTARAHKCDLPELVIANRDALLLREKNKKKWSESQLQYINALHLYTVQLLVGKIEVVDKDKPKPEFDPKGNAPMPPDNVVKCSDKEKQEISSAVEANEKLVGKS